MEFLNESTLSQATFFMCSWKGYHALEDIKQFISTLVTYPESANVYLLAVPFPYLKELSKQITNPSIILGSSAMNNASPGSFTEKIASKMIQANNGRFTLIGTAESRQKYGETDESINHKIINAIDAGIVPILFVGETFEQVKEGTSVEVLTKQLKSALKELSTEDLLRIAIVYEAPWLSKSEEQLSNEKLVSHCFLFRQALMEVIDQETFSKMRLLDVFPSEIKDPEALLKTIKGRGFYATDPKAFFTILEAKNKQQGELASNENLPPLTPLFNKREPVVAAPRIKSVEAPRKPEIISPEPLEEEGVEVSEKLADVSIPSVLIPEKKPAPVNVSETNLIEEVVESVQLVEKKPMEGSTRLPEAEIESALKSSTPLETETKALEESPEFEKQVVKSQTEPAKPQEREINLPEVAPAVNEPEVKSTEIMAKQDVSKPLETAEESFQEKEREVKPEEEMMAEKSQEPLAMPEQHEQAEEASILPNEDKVGRLPISNQSIEGNAPTDIQLESEELQARLDSLLKANEALGECYKKIKDLSERLPYLRKQFPDLLSKMTADLNKLDPFLQEKINTGNVSYFSENPDKAKEASVVLVQLQNLSQLFQETAAIPRDVDRLMSKSRELRKDLETEWAYFRTNKKKIKEKFPDFSFPTHPSQLLIPEPVIDLTPKDSPPATLGAKRFAVVKAPPLKK